MEPQSTTPTLVSPQPTDVTILNDTMSYDYHLLGFSFAAVFFIAIVGTIGNLLAAVALLMNKKLRHSPSTAFIVNFSICLLPLCVVCMPVFGVGCLHIRQYGHLLYTASQYTTIFAMGDVLNQVHLHTMSGFAFSRLLAVMWPQQYKKMMQPRWVKLYILLIWAYSLLLWLPLVFGGFSWLTFDKTKLLVKMESKSLLVKAMHVFFTFILPFLFTGICYLIIYVKVRFVKQIREARLHGKSIAEDSTLKQWDEQVARSILIIFVILVCLNVPHLAIHIMELNKDHPNAWVILHLMYWQRFYLDPVVYIACSQQYRDAVKEFFNRFRYHFISTGHSAHTASLTLPSSQFPQRSHTPSNFPSTSNTLALSEEILSSENETQPEA